MEIKTDGMYGGQKVEVVRLPDGEREIFGEHKDLHVVLT